MSADNGIYVLETDGPEYRVRDIQAIENMYWGRCSIHGSDMHFGNMVRNGVKDEDCAECRGATPETATPEMVLENAREMYKGCQVFTDKGKAYEYAVQLYETSEICEYGIVPLKIIGKF
jgi:hypothetical protein